MQSRQDWAVINTLFLLVSLFVFSASCFLVLLLEIVSMFVGHQIMTHVLNDLFCITAISAIIPIFERITLHWVNDF
jgi:hypothetical protein